MRILRKIKENKKGFTLVEILVVLVILAILAAVSIPTMTGFITEARKKAYTAEARSVFVAAQAATSELSVNATAPTEDDIKARAAAFLAGDITLSEITSITLDPTNANKVHQIVYTSEEGGVVVTITADGGVTYGDATN